MFYAILAEFFIQLCVSFVLVLLQNKRYPIIDLCHDGRHPSLEQETIELGDQKILFIATNISERCSPQMLH